MSIAPRAIAFALIAAFFMAAPARAADAERGWIEQPPIASKALNESRQYRIDLPPSYDTNANARFPVLYVLDAQNHQQHVAGSANYLARAGEIPEMIIVAIDSGNRLRDFTPTDTDNWVGDGGAANFLAFLRDELVPAIEKNYRANDLRIVWGHSASALLALHSLYAEPALFDAYLVNDGDLGWDNKLPEHELKKYFAQVKQQQKFLYFNNSYQLSEDPEVNVFVSLANMLESNAPETLRWKHEPMQNETHFGIALEGNIRALRALFDGYQVPEPVMFQGLDAVEAHYARIRNQLGAPRQTPEAVLNELGYLMLQRNMNESIRAFELATERYPQSDNAWDSLSDGYLEAGRLQDALQATEQSIELAKSNGSSNMDYYQEKKSGIAKRLTAH